MSGEIRRNERGEPVLTLEQVIEAHAYADDLIAHGASDRDVSPLQLALALANVCRGFARAQFALATISGVIAAARGAGVVPETADEDEDEEDEDERPDPRLN